MEKFGQFNAPGYGIFFDKTYDYPLLHAKNTVLTPHVAFLSDESMIRRAHIVFETLMTYLDGHVQNVCELN